MCRFLCEIVKHIRRAPERADKIGGHHREDQGGINSPCSAYIKLAKGEPAKLQVPQNIAGNEIAGNNKEDIDADEAAFEAADLEMKQDHAGYSDGAQPGDFSAKRTCHTCQSASRRGLQGCSMRSSLRATVALIGCQSAGTKAALTI